MAKCKVDWSRLRHEYVTSPQGVTLTDLAEANGLARETVNRRASKEQWAFQRDRFLARLDEQTAEKKAEIVSDWACQWDTECKEAAKLLIQRAIEEIKQGAKSRDVAGSLKIAQEMGKAAAGDRTQSEVNLTLTNAIRRLLD